MGILCFSSPTYNHTDDRESRDGTGDEDVRARLELNHDLCLSYLFYDRLENSVNTLYICLARYPPAHRTPYDTRRHPVYMSSLHNTT